ncbi:MAG: HEAT repeat domain-containing protein [Verrucomicrobiaceae bacterium]|nr:HEAT repeat domain-containing protein [Verrucomicrobiaceae bacterium]
MTLRHLLLASLVATAASALTVQEMQQRFRPIVKDMPPMSNQPGAFPGVVKHPGLSAQTWVRFPFVQNPGSFGIDRKGRIFVAEANRLWQGTADLRGINEFIRGDFQSQTLEDRAKLQISIPGRVPEGFWTNTPDRLIRLEDSDGNGAADKRTVFADSFYEQLDGIGFSVLPEDDAVYFTCIPSLRKLTDTNDDGIADTNDSVLAGFGVRVSFIGHDLHGLVRGPDGRLYFTIGDRGYHVTTKEGEVLAESSRGAIFRCESDGTGFEVFCHGLRNPTELAFDENGNLFTFDNTGDIGDKARMVYALEGTDSGWDMSHQCAHQYVDHMDWGDFHPKISVWVAENMFAAEAADRPQWIYPPAANVGRGPSGVAWNTGEAAPADLRSKLLLVDYGGAPQSCKIHAIGVKNSGAGYALDSADVLVEGAGASDVEQGYDGKIYICDFGGGWTVNDNGAIHTLTPTDKTLQATAAEMAARFKRGVHGDSTEQLVAAMRSPDRRLRQMAQIELVKRGETDALVGIAMDASLKTTARLHGVWGLGQLARQKNASALTSLLELSKDKDVELRANAARALGDVDETARARLLELLRDESPRVRSLAAISLSRVAKPGDKAAIAAVIEVAKANGAASSVDLVLRHACGTALKRLGTVESAVALASDASQELRLLSLLQLRHQGSKELARFLTDADADIRNEAIRAIYDTAALDTEAGDALAKLKPDADMPPLVQRRVICASYRKGTADHAKLLLQHAASGSLDLSVREAALHGLRMWEKKITADPVLGGYRPIPGEARSMKALGEVIGADLKQFLASTPPPKLAALALKLADETGTVLDSQTLVTLVNNTKQQPAVRVAALDSLVKSAPDQARGLLPSHFTDKQPEVVGASLRHGQALKLDGVLVAARKAADTAPPAAARAGLEVIAAEQPAEALDRWTKRETNGLRKELWLDLFLALQSSSNDAAKHAAATYAASSMDAVQRLGMFGGDIKQGEFVFRNQGGCMQCHKMGKDGGIQGPPLELVGERLKPEKIVESLVNPNAEIAAGYGLSSVTLNDGTLVVGRISADTKESITVVTADGKEATHPRTNVKTIAPPVSAMPPMGMALPPTMLRDLIAYLSSRTKATAPKDASSDAHGEAEKVTK